jgi:hypothetical protein
MHLSKWQRHLIKKVDKFVFDGIGNCRESSAGLLIGKYDNS